MITDFWTKTPCDGCLSKMNVTTYVVKHRPSAEGNRIHLCLKCRKEMSKLLKED